MMFLYTKGRRLFSGLPFQFSQIGPVFRWVRCRAPSSSETQEDPRKTEDGAPLTVAGLCLVYVKKV